MKSKHALSLRFFHSVILTFLALQFAIVARPCAGESAGKVKVGVILPLSGSLAEFGSVVRNAFELAKSEHPDQFGAVEFIYEDYQSDAKNSISAFNMIVSNNDVSAVYIWGATAAETLAPVAQSRKVPLIAMSISRTVGINRPLVMRALGSSTDLVSPILPYLLKNKITRLTLLYTEWVYTEELAKALKELAEDKISITTISIAKSELNFRPIFPKIAAGEPQAVAVFLGAGQISQFYKVMAELKQNYATIGDDFFANPVEIQNSGAAIEGAVFPLIKMCNQISSSYVRRYKNDTFISHAANAYDMALLFAITAKKVGGGSAFFEELQLPIERHGICGDFKASDSASTGKYFDYPTALYRIKDGRIEAAD